MCFQPLTGKIAVQYRSPSSQFHKNYITLSSTLALATSEGRKACAERYSRSGRTLRKRLLKRNSPRLELVGQDLEANSTPWRHLMADIVHTRCGNARQHF